MSIDPFHRTPGAFATCTATCGNGRRTSTVPTKTARWPTSPQLRQSAESHPRRSWYLAPTAPVVPCATHQPQDRGFSLDFAWCENHCENRNRMKAHSSACAAALSALLVSLPRVLHSRSPASSALPEIAPIEQRLEEVVKSTSGLRVPRRNARGTIDRGRPFRCWKSQRSHHHHAADRRVQATSRSVSGTAGAIDPALRPGDVVIGTSVAQHDAGSQTADGIRLRGLRNAVTGEVDPLIVPAPEPLLSLARRSAKELRLPSIRIDNEDHLPRIVEGVIVTGDVFVSDEVRRETLRSTLGATAVEMEGAAVVQTCRQFGVSCLIVRGITDRADGQAQTSYDRFIAAASEHAARLVTAIIAGCDNFRSWQWTVTSARSSRVEGDDLLRNTATMSVGCAPAVEAYERAAKQWSAGRLDWLEAEFVPAKTHALFAQIVEHVRSETALVPAVSIAAGIVAANLPPAKRGREHRRSRERIQLSNYFPWLLLRDRGYEVRTARRWIRAADGVEARHIADVVCGAGREGGARDLPPVRDSGASRPQCCALSTPA